MQILFFFLFFFPQFVVQRREKKRPDLEHVRASPVGPVGGEEDEEEKEEKKTGVRLHDHLFHMYPAVRNETEWLVYIPVTCVTSHACIPEKKKTYLHDPERSRFVIHLFPFFLHYYKRRKKREL
jgi:hypothetical protein